jgi:hypothetical protein
MSPTDSNHTTATPVGHAGAVAVFAELSETATQGWLTEHG